MPGSQESDAALSDIADYLRSIQNYANLLPKNEQALLSSYIEAISDFLQAVQKSKDPTPIIIQALKNPILAFHRDIQQEDPEIIVLIKQYSKIITAEMIYEKIKL